MRRAHSSSVYPPVYSHPGPASRQVRRLRPAMLALSIAAAFTSLPIASQNVLPVHKADVVGTSTRSYNAAGTQLTVTTTNGQGASHSAINWQSFSIGAGNATRFQQPNAASLSINRVVTNVPSQIFGTLSSNGKLVLVNQSGITVGAGAVVDTAGFTASVLGMSDADAAAGRIRFNADGLGQATGALRVEGNIIARGGDVVLIAPDIQVAKTAVVEAENGTAILAAGRRVEVTGRGLEGIVMQVQAPADKAVNLGTLRGDAVGIFAGQLRHSGIIQANGVSMEGGRVVLRAQDLAEVNGSIQAGRTINGQTSGGSVEISAGHVASLNGSIDVRGSAGGAVTVAAQNILQGGQVDASGTAGGGSIQIVARDYVEQTAAAQVRADGGSGAGGTVRVQATAEAGEVLSSATITADGAQGGSVVVAAPSIRLQAARVGAEGLATVNGSGGSIRIGGGRQGNDPDVPDSQYVFINNATIINAGSRRSGKGGTAIVWSDGVTRFSGTVLARGGSDAGDGGFIEVSGKESLEFRGMASAGAPNGANGTLLLDPKNIIVQGGSTGLDPDPEPMGSTGDFGADAFVMDGKLVITDPLNDVGGEDAGAIYVFDRLTGSLLGSLKGSHVNDRIGESYQYSPLASGTELLFRAPGWDGDKGAVTFLSPGSYTGSAVVSGANSFVGTTAGDKVGYSLPEAVYAPGGTALLFGTPDWGGGKGAIFRVFSGDTVRSGEVSAATALVGKLATDRLGDWGSGTGNTRLFKAYYSGQDQFLLSYSHFDGNRGAVTLGNVTQALVGEVGGQDGGGAPLNFSLRGSTAGDLVGSIVTPTQQFGSTTDWIVRSPFWQFDAGTPNAGAVSFIRAVDAGNLASASNGVVSAANSLVSDAADSYFGQTMYTQTALGYYLVVASGWNSDRGAVTWSSMAAPKTGVVSDSNSLVGTTSGDMVGSSISNISGSSAAQYVIGSPNWSYDAGGSVYSNAGALTVISNTDVAGFVGAGNSLVGTHSNDYIGDNFFVYGSNGAVVSAASGWDGGKGAITRIDLASPAWGEVSASNSLVGSLTTDQVGERIIGNSGYGYLLSVAANWGGGKGAVTFMPLTGTAATGVVSASNSLVGGTTLDHIGGSIASLSTEFYSYSFLQSGTGVELLGNGDYLVRAPDWDNARGLVAFGPASGGVTGELSVANAQSIALVGAMAGDRLGESVASHYDGSYMVFTPNWYGDKGAITWGAAGTGAIGTVDMANSLYGTTLSHFGASLVNISNSYYGDTFLALTPDWDGGKGALTVIGRQAPSSPGYVSAGNSVVGSAAGDYLGCLSSCGPGTGTLVVPQNLGGNWWAVGSPNINNGAGAVTFIYSGSDAVANSVAAKAPSGLLDGMSVTNLSLLGSHGVDGDFAGDRYGRTGQVMARQNYYNSSSDGSGAVAVANGDWAYGRGAVTMLDLSQMAGSMLVSDTNSLVGSTPDTYSGGTLVSSTGDYIGASTLWSNDRQQLIVTAPNWNDNRGAVAVTDWSTSTNPPQWFGNRGQISATNAFVGTVSGDRIGSSDFGNDMVMDLDNGQLLIVSPNWGNHKGAATILDLSAVNGTVDADSTNGNSMIGEADGDYFGEGATASHVAKIGNTLVLASPGWKNGYGALTWINMDSPGGTMSSASNSLVGSSLSDQVGSDGIVGAGTRAEYAYGDFTGGNYLNVTLALSSNWGGQRGAITLLTGTPATGAVSATNSFVGDISGGEGDKVGSGILACDTCSLENLDVFDNGAVMLRTNRALDSQSYLTVFTPDATFTGTLNNASSMQFGTSELNSTYSSHVLQGDRLMLLMPGWNGNMGAIRVVDAGAAQAGDPTLTATANTGLTSAANALVGSTAGDRVGSGFSNSYYNYEPYSPAGIGSGRYLVASPYWDGNKGAVTEFNLGATPVIPVGALGSGNSLVGTSANDFGGVTNASYEFLSDWVHRFSDGSYLLANPYFGGGQGAITHMKADPALNKGVLGAANSLVGGAGNTNGYFGFYGRGSYSNGGYQSYLVVNDGWMDYRGMATVFNQGAAGNPLGAITDLNALVGSAADDRVGDGVYTSGLGSGNFIVASQNWNNGRGAISWGSTVAGVTTLARGAVSSTNSLVGSHDGDHVGGGLSGEGGAAVGLLQGTTDRYYVITSDYSGGRGAYTFVNKGETGTVNDNNSIVGSYTGGLQGGYSFSLTPQRLDSEADVFMLRFGGEGVNADGPGQVYLTSSQMSGGGASWLGGMLFGDASDATVTISPDRITSIANTGTDVILQASNDIDIRSEIHLAVANPGTMVFEAGRNIMINANIRTGGGDLGLIANSPNANPAYRDAGPGGISMYSGAFIDLGGSGDMIAEVGTGVVGAQGGAIELGNIHHGAGLLARNLSTSANAGIVQVPGTVWDVEKLAMETRGDNGNIGTLDQRIHFTGDELAIRTANAPADIQHTGEELYFTTADFDQGLAVTGGAADPGYRGIVLGGKSHLNLTSAGSIYLVAGTDPVAIQADSMHIKSAALTLHGGTAPGAYAAIVSAGDLKLETESLQMIAGTAPDADAVILAANGEALSGQFSQRYLGVGDTRANGVTNTGFGTLVVFYDSLTQQFMADQSFMSDFLNNYYDEQRRQRRSGRGDIVLEQTCN